MYHFVSWSSEAADVNTSVFMAKVLYCQMAVRGTNHHHAITWRPIIFDDGIPDNQFSDALFPALFYFQPFHNSPRHKPKWVNGTSQYHGIPFYSHYKIVWKCIFFIEICCRPSDRSIGFPHQIYVYQTSLVTHLQITSKSLNWITILTQCKDLTRIVLPCSV